MSEQWYDEEIAPKLVELCKACKDRGLSFFAMVEYAHGDRAETRWIAPNAGLPMYMAPMLAHHGDNVDGFVINLIRHCRKMGIDWSSSMVLRQLGGEYSEKETAVTPPKPCPVCDASYSHAWNCSLNQG